MSNKKKQEAEKRRREQERKQQEEKAKADFFSGNSNLFDAPTKIVDDTVSVTYQNFFKTP